MDSEAPDGLPLLPDAGELFRNLVEQVPAVVYVATADTLMKVATSGAAATILSGSAGAAAACGAGFSPQPDKLAAIRTVSDVSARDERRLAIILISTPQALPRHRSDRAIDPRPDQGEGGSQSDQARARIKQNSYAMRRGPSRFRHLIPFQALFRGLQGRQCGALP